MARQQRRVDSRRHRAAHAPAPRRIRAWLCAETMRSVPGAMASAGDDAGREHVRRRCRRLARRRRGDRRWRVRRRARSRRVRRAATSASAPKYREPARVMRNSAKAFRSRACASRPAAMPSPSAAPSTGGLALVAAGRLALAAVGPRTLGGLGASRAGALGRLLGQQRDGVVERQRVDLVTVRQRRVDAAVLDVGAVAARRATPPAACPSGACPARVAPAAPRPPRSGFPASSFCGRAWNSNPILPSGCFTRKALKRRPLLRDERAADRSCRFRAASSSARARWPLQDDLAGAEIAGASGPIAFSQTYACRSRRRACRTSDICRAAPGR